MSASPQLQSAPQISSPHAIVGAPSANALAPNSPSYVANAHLALLLSESYLDIESLRCEVAITKKHADKAEHLLANYTQANSANGGAPINILQIPEATICDYETCIEHTENAREEADARRCVITDAWAQVEHHLQAADLSAADIRSAFSCILLDGSGQLSLAMASVQHFTNPHGSFIRVRGGICFWRTLLLPILVICSQ